MALTEEERTILEARLNEAEEAFHRLQTGQQEVSVGHEGESVSYTAANRVHLRNYINELKQQLGLRSSSRTRSRRVFF